MALRTLTRSLPAEVMLLALTCVLAVLSGCRRGSAPEQDEIIVFAAASTADAIAEVGRDFEAETATRLRFSFGASRDLARQIRAGAPAAIMVSADAATVDALVDAKLVRSEDRRVFATNRLVVVVPTAASTTIRSARDLVAVPHLAVGDPELVPAGSYAQQWLEKEALWTDVMPHIVPALDVRAALAAVETGHAEAGIVYRTDAAKSERVRIVYEVPADRVPPITYVAALVASAEGSAVRSFFDFLTGPKGRSTFARYGFAP